MEPSRSRPGVLLELPEMPVAGFGSEYIGAPEDDVYPTADLFRLGAGKWNGILRQQVSEGSAMAAADEAPIRGLNDTRRAVDVHGPTADSLG